MVFLTTTTTISSTRTSKRRKQKQQCFTSTMIVALTSMTIMTRLALDANVFVSSFTSTSSFNKCCQSSFYKSYPTFITSLTSSPSTTTLHMVSTGNIGLGPAQPSDGEDGAVIEEERELVAGVDYEIPNHEEYRTSRRNKFDEKCDEWFTSLVENSGDEEKGILMSGKSNVGKDVKDLLLTPVELKNEEQLPIDDPNFTPYVTTRLPWTPLFPSFGCEQYGMPTPRRNAECWRHFDVNKMISTNYGHGIPDNYYDGEITDLSEEQIESYRTKLHNSGGWLNDDQVEGRLVYINGRFAPQLSKTTEDYKNLQSLDDDDRIMSEEIQSYLSRLTDGFTDTLAAPVPSGEKDFLTSYKTLSGPDHSLGDPTSQFAINVQQGNACFAALNTMKTNSIAYIHQPNNKVSDKPVLIVNAVTSDSGCSTNCNDDDNNGDKEQPKKGVTYHPRVLLVAEENSNLSFVQASVDLDSNDEEEENKLHNPSFYNGYTQIFVKENANVTHSYIEQTGGIVTSGVEYTDNDIETMPNGKEKILINGEKPFDIEQNQRKEQDNLHLDTIDAHVIGENGRYENTILSVGGSGLVRIGLSVTLLKPKAHGTINGFMLSGGLQKCDIKTNIHHIAQGTTSEQQQKNMVGGRSSASFRGRIRVEQSAQQTDSDQISRNLLLSDRCRVWTVPSLEIIADDVQCTHGATVSDLSEEELFYLCSRGLKKDMARNLLMYAFVGDVSQNIDKIYMNDKDGGSNSDTSGFEDLDDSNKNIGLQKRIIKRLQNLVPKGDRAMMGEYQSV